VTNTCTIPPEGWECTRESGHDGPCAAVQSDTDGTLESLATCAAMLETYGPECFPENELGQVHFARVMMDSTAAEIRAFLAKTGGAA